jgi:hypothetical protein
VFVGVFVLAFATLVTVHVAVAGWLAFRARPWWRGPLALAVPPLAPIFAYRAGWRGAAIVARLAAAT